MKIIQNGAVFETENQFVIEQMLKYGGVEVVEVTEKPKAEKPKKETVKK